METNNIEKIAQEKLEQKKQEQIDKIKEQIASTEEGVSVAATPGIEVGSEEETTEKPVEKPVEVSVNDLLVEGEDQLIEGMPLVDPNTGAIKIDRPVLQNHQTTDTVKLSEFVPRSEDTLKPNDSWMDRVMDNNKTSVRELVHEKVVEDNESKVSDDKPEIGKVMSKEYFEKTMKNINKRRRLHNDMRLIPPSPYYALPQSLTVNKRFLDINFDIYNNDYTIENNLYSNENHEKRAKIAMDRIDYLKDNLTVREWDILNGTNIMSDPEDIKKYISIISKLLDSEIFKNTKNDDIIKPGRYLGTTSSNINGNPLYSPVYICESDTEVIPERGDVVTFLCREYVFDGVHWLGY